MPGWIGRGRSDMKVEVTDDHGWIGAVPRE